MTKNSSGTKLLLLWLLAAFVVGGVLGWQVLGSTKNINQEPITLTSEDVDAICAEPTNSTSASNDQLLRTSSKKVVDLCAARQHGKEVEEKMMDNGDTYVKCSDGAAMVIREKWK